MQEDQQQQEASGGESSQIPEAESLPPIEAGTDPTTAAEVAAEALAAVKATEVQSLAEVLTRLNEKEAEMSGLISRLESAVQAISEMQAQAATALEDIQMQQAQMQQAQEVQQAQPIAQNGKRGLGAILG